MTKYAAIAVPALQCAYVCALACARACTRAHMRACVRTCARARVRKYIPVFADRTDLSTRPMSTSDMIFKYGPPSRQSLPLAPLGANTLLVSSHISYGILGMAY